MMGRYRAAAILFLLILSLGLLAIAGEPSTGQSLSERAYFSLQVGTTFELLQTEVVRREIGLSDAQKEKLAALEKDLIESIDKIFRDDSEVPQGTLGRQLKERDRKFQAKFGEILRHDQLERLGEIILQTMSLLQPGNEMISELPDEFNRELIGSLQISETQEKEIRSIRLGTRGALEAVFKDFVEKLPRLSDPQVRAELHKRCQLLQPILAEANRKISAILTPKQREAIKRAKGKEIDFVAIVEEIAQSELADLAK